MKVTIWSAILVLAVGVWDLIVSIKRWPKNNSQVKAKDLIAPKVSKSNTSKGSAIAFLILGIIFTITGIVMFFL